MELDIIKMRLDEFNKESKDAIDRINKEIGPEMYVVCMMQVKIRDNTGEIKTYELNQKINHRLGI